MTPDPIGTVGDLHRIGGGSVEDLRLKPAETGLDPPGISVFHGGSPAHAAEQMRAAFPNATKLHGSARIVGTTTAEAIRAAGFDIQADPTRRFPNHHRIVHPAGVAGFTDVNLARLAAAFANTSTEG